MSYYKIKEFADKERCYKLIHHYVIALFNKRVGYLVAPTHSAEVKLRYDEIKYRSDMTLHKYLTDCGFFWKGENYVTIMVNYF